MRPAHAQDDLGNGEQVRPDHGVGGYFAHQSFRLEALSSPLRDFFCGNSIFDDDRKSTP